MGTRRSCVDGNGSLHHDAVDMRSPTPQSRELAAAAKAGGNWGRSVSELPDRSAAWLRRNATREHHLGLEAAFVESEGHSPARENSRSFGRKLMYCKRCSAAG